VTRGILRGVVIVLAVLASLAMQPPMESSIGREPVPEIVGMTGSETSTEEAGTMDWMKLGQFAITQGGLALVALCMFWWVTRELQRQKAEKAEVVQVLIAIVDKNTTAMVHSEQTNARLARAIEAHKLVPPGSNL
jgi:hypothetical protein